MITLEPIDGPAYIVRVCPMPGDPLPKFTAWGHLQPHPSDPTLATMKALNGDLTLHTLRELLAKLRELGLETIRAQRADGHTLPCSTLHEDGYLRCDLLALEKRFFRPCP